jgi:hypothetical protein
MHFEIIAWDYPGAETASMRRLRPADGGSVSITSACAGFEAANRAPRRACDDIRAFSVP